MTTTAARSTRPLGATDVCPLVVSTEDLARYLNRRLETVSADSIVNKIKTLKELGVVLTAVSADVLKRIIAGKNVATADNAAESILISQGANELLGSEQIPLYRNPFMDNKTYLKTMKNRLRQGWDDEVDGEWNEKEQLQYILSFQAMPH